MFVVAIIMQFATGSSRVPLGGFGNLRGMEGLCKFTLQKIPKQKRLPMATTCFNMLKLPEYASFDELKKWCDYIVKNRPTGFGYN